MPYRPGPAGCIRYARASFFQAAGVVDCRPGQRRRGIGVKVSTGIVAQQPECPGGRIVQLPVRPRQNALHGGLFVTSRVQQAHPMPQIG